MLLAWLVGVMTLWARLVEMCIRDSLYADPAKARRELGWTLKFPDIESIVATAWKWHAHHPGGFGK